MNKIKDKLNNHPRLKKCLKLLAVVGMCLSVLFNALILGVAIADNVRNGAESKSVKNVATTPIKNVFPADMNGERHNLYTISDICSANGYYALLSYLRDIDYYAPIYNFQGTQMFMNLVEYGGANNIDNVINLQAYTLDDTNTPSTIFNARRLRFYSENQTDAYGHKRHFLFMGLGNDGNNNEYGIEWYEYYDTGFVNFRGIAGNLVISNCKYRADWTTNNYVVVDSIALFSPKPMTDYANGDASILDLMFYSLFDGNSWSLGYNSGYKDGETARPSEDNSSPFALLSKGFDAVANVLNIQLLPNLTIGILLFTPVIVAVIIVVVKMVKG